MKELGQILYEKLHAEQYGSYPAWNVIATSVQDTYRVAAATVVAAAGRNHDNSRPSR